MTVEKRFRVFRFGGNSLHSWAVFHANDVKNIKYGSIVTWDQATPVMSGLSKSSAYHQADIMQRPKEDGGNMTYRELMELIKQAARTEGEAFLDTRVVVYQTDNFTRQVQGMQIGVGGSFIRSTREWQR